MLCLSASWTTVLTFLPTILEEERGVGIASGGVIFGFLYYVLIPGGFLGSKIPGISPTAAWMVVAPAVFNVACTIGAILAGNVALVALALAGLGLVWVFVPAMEVLPFEFRAINERQVSVISALVLTFGAVGFASGPLAAGVIAEITGSLMTGVLSVAAFTGLAIVAAMLFPRNPAAVEVRVRTSPASAS